ncbi:hypothetical protein M422DRAFT_261684 [Sphaerobolus stellatus SS14]|uniref:Uncharacterized protein n=1 Tax=Sphaerobolus stellatus (strain SS14) TaxID=990650 RepID=A0A0C9V2Q8_SPHS4|nr:hypothetical protein M422DRAFT_261684 [Sphaerobolus stellatus SS14]
MFEASRRSRAPYATGSFLLSSFPQTCNQFRDLRWPSFSSTTCAPYVCNDATRDDRLCMHIVTWFFLRVKNASNIAGRIFQLREPKLFDDLQKSLAVEPVKLAKQGKRKILPMQARRRQVSKQEMDRVSEKMQQAPPTQVMIQSVVVANASAAQAQATANGQMASPLLAPGGMPHPSYAFSPYGIQYPYPGGPPLMPYAPPTAPLPASTAPPITPFPAPVALLPSPQVSNQYPNGISPPAA